MGPDAPQGLTRDIGRVQKNADGEGRAETRRGMDMGMSEAEPVTVPVAMIVIMVMVIMIVVRMVMRVMLMRKGGAMMIVIAGAVVMGI